MYKRQGWALPDLKDERVEFIAACQFALEHDAVVVAHSWDRYLRSEDYKHNSGISPADLIYPSIEEFERLKGWSGGARLACLWPVDTPVRQIKRLEQEFNPTKLRDHGRRLTDTKREMLTRLVRYGKQRGLSLRELAMLYRVSYGTVKRMLG